MITVDDVGQIHRLGREEVRLAVDDREVGPYFEFVRDVANAFMAAGAEEPLVREGLKRGFWQDFGRPLNPTMLKLQIVSEIEDATGMLAPQEVKDMAPRKGAYVPPAPALPQPQPAYAPRADVASLVAWMQRFRTPASLDAGRRLVSTAGTMHGWFHWVASGPMGLGDRPFGAPRASLYRPMGGGNDFARWMNNQGGEPDQNASINCWEAVLFAAYRAGLVAENRLRQVHGEGTESARRTLRSSGYGHSLPGSYKSVTREDLPPERLQQAALTAYYDKLSDFLGVRDAVRVETDLGSPLKPRPGDILFFGGHAHVAIYTRREREDRNGRGSWTYVARSLWNVPADGFYEVDLNILTAAGPATFRPCPFG